jgi:hypothetical protein
MSRRQNTGFAEGMFTGMAKSRAAGDAPPKVFDWDKAAEIIRDRKPDTAEAGLAEDWSHTGGTIYRDGRIVPQADTYTYLQSKWATPMLVIDGEEIDCFTVREDWDAGTYWPQSAQDILNAK